MTLIDCLTFFAILGLLIAVGIYRSKSTQTESDYLFAKRKTGFAALTATLVMTEFNSATLLSFAALGYIAGFRALLLPFIFLFGLLFYALSVAKKWKAFDGTSVAGFFTQRYGKGIGTSASLLLILAMLGFSAAYIKSLVLLFQPLVPSLSPWTVSIWLLLVILIMSLRGGLIAIIRTDTLSLALALLFFPLMAFFVWKAPALSEPLALTEQILPLRFIFSLTLLTMFSYILAPWYGQKIFAATSQKTAYLATLCAALLVFFLYGIAIFATALMRAKGFETPVAEGALPLLIDKCLPLGLKGCAYALLFATSATTLTGVWSAMSSMWIGDFLREKSKSSYKRSSLITVIFACISCVLAHTLIDRILDKIILANIPVVALSFGLLAGFYWKRASWQGVYLSMVIGCACAVGFYLHFGESGGYTWYWAVYGIPLIFASGILGSLFYPHSRPLKQHPSQ